MKIRVPSYIRELVPYRPGKSIEEILNLHGLHEAVKLASNENPLGPSPKAIEAAASALRTMELYPNGGKTIREALALHYGLSAEEIIAGSGSEGVMNTAMRTFLNQGDEVLTSAGTFGGFYVLANAMGLKLTLAPMKDYAYDLDAILERIVPNTRMIYLANPNNPTGSYFTRATLDAFLARVPEDVLVIYDEAYCDFAGSDALDYPSLFTARRSNVITLRTFSKSHGLAGIRIGYGSGAPELIGMMLKVKLPFEPSEAAQAAGIAALGDDDFLLRTIRTNQEGKQQFERAFEEMGIRYVPTAANFFCIILEGEQQAKSLIDEMERFGVIIRPLQAWGLPGGVRISIGTSQQNARAIKVLKDVLEPIASIA